MSENKRDGMRRGYEETLNSRLTLPFFVVLAILTAVSFMISLRPTVSNSEKRELAKFPEFSWSALASGSYFDDISTWYSDTFPGREGWIGASVRISGLHGYSEIAIEGNLEPVSDEVPGSVETEGVSSQVPDPPAPWETAPATTEDRETEPAQTETTEATEATEATEPTWGGINAGQGAEISLGTAIQIGDSAFNQLGFSKWESDRYIETLSAFAAAMKDQGVRVISCPAPTAVGIMVEKEYLGKLNCAPQDDMINYLHGGMSNDVVKVDTFSNIVRHNNEYIYFRTDHHWTALGAYYAYEALCLAAGMEPAPLDSFEVWDQGEFKGSLYGKVSWPNKLRADNLIAYIPAGEITMVVYDPDMHGQEKPLLQDKSNDHPATKYLTFICGDYALTEITNEDIPEGSSCLVIKDSYGNAFAPFLTQNYHKVYCIDYRMFYASSLKVFVEKYEIDDVIFAPYLIATQDTTGNNLFTNHCR